MMTRQPRLPRTQKCISHQQYRAPGPANHKPEQRREIVAEVNPHQRVLQFAQVFPFVAIDRNTVDERQLFCHRLMRIGVVMARRFQIGMIMQAHRPGTDAQQPNSDPEQQLQHAEKQSFQRQQTNHHHRHRQQHHQQRAQQREPVLLAKQRRQVMIQLPVLAHFEQAFPAQNQQQTKKRHACYSCTGASGRLPSASRNLVQSKAGPGSVFRTGAISLCPVMCSAIPG